MSVFKQSICKNLVVIGGLFFVLVFPKKSHAQVLRFRPPEAEVCKNLEWIFIGKVVKREAFEMTYPAPATGFTVATAVTLELEMTIRGEPPLQVVVRRLGGVVGQDRPNDPPEMPIGSRQLVFANPTHEPNPRDGTILLEARRLNEQAPLPPAEIVQAIWREHCDSTFDRTLRPTEAFLKFIPQDLIEWCEHY